MEQIMKGVYYWPAKQNGDNRSVYEKYPELCRAIGITDTEESDQDND